MTDVNNARVTNVNQDGHGTTAVHGIFTGQQRC